MPPIPVVTGIIYLIIGLIPSTREKVVIFLGKTHSFVVFWLVQNVFVPESFPGSIDDLETEKAAADCCPRVLGATSFFLLMNFSELSEIMVASSTSDKVGALDTRKCTCSGLA